MTSATRAGSRARATSIVSHVASPSTTETAPVSSLRSCGFNGIVIYSGPQSLHQHGDGPVHELLRVLPVEPFLEPAHAFSGEPALISPVVEVERAAVGNHHPHVP